MKKIIVVTGTTACGKSEFAFKVARGLGGEIVMCDTLQMYRNFPVAANHPPKQYTNTLQYHNLAELDCFATRLNVYQVAERVRASCNKIILSGKVPVIEGGSVFHLNSLLKNEKPISEQELAPHASKAKQLLGRPEYSRNASHQWDQSWLEMTDKIEAELGLPTKVLASVTRNDFYRLQKKIMYELFKLNNHSAPVQQPTEERFDWRVFILTPSGSLPERINRRCFETVNEKFFSQMEQLKRVLQQKKLTPTDIGAPLGAAEAIELIEQAGNKLPEFYMAKKINKFMETFQGYNRSYSTWQRKYLKKYFQQAVQLNTTPQMDPLKTILPYFECTREEYLIRLQSEPTQETATKSSKSQRGIPPSPEQLYALQRILRKYEKS